VQSRFSNLLIALLLAACTPKLAGWSEVKPWENGEGKVVATIGLVLLGSSGRVAFLLGPGGSVAAPASPEVDQEVPLAAARPIGTWTVEKAGTKIALARDADGSPKTQGYENIDTEVWALISSPGCSRLAVALNTGSHSGGPVLHKTYSLCEVDAAVAMLRASKPTPR
jgi:hypothetical protein